MPHFTKPAEGTLDRALRARHRPGLLRGLDLARALRARARRDLPPDVAERRPGRAAARATGSYFTKELDAARTSVVVVRGTRRRGARLPQHLPAPRQQARVERLPARGDERHLPPVHLQVPRLALRPRRRAAPSCSRSRSSSTSTRPTTGWRPCSCEVWEGFIFVNLDRRRHDAAARVHGRARRGPRGLPVPRDDPGAQVPRRGRQQLEALHRRVRRVLPRTGPAREAGRGRGVAQAPGLRLRGARLRASTARTGWCRRGAACRRRRT